MITELDQASWPDLRGGDSGERVLIVPLGATEQHGPHLPLSTDTDIAVAIAREVAAKRSNTLVAPPIPYGSSGEHQDFPGTVSIGPAATELLLIELVRSARSLCGRVVLLSAHGGNADAVRAAVMRLREEGISVLSWSPRWNGDAHAGRTETSIMLALKPETVQLDRAEPGNTAPLVRLWPILRERGISAVSPNGVLGDPAGASASEGRLLLKAAVAALREAIDVWELG